jgi:hypothetical protein
MNRLPRAGALADLDPNAMVSIGVAAWYLGVSVDTMRKYDVDGRFPADSRTPGRQRRYRVSRILRAVSSSGRAGSSR